MRTGIYKVTSGNGNSRPLCFSGVSLPSDIVGGLFYWHRSAEESRKGGDTVGELRNAHDPAFREASIGCRSRVTLAC